MTTSPELDITPPLLSLFSKSFASYVEIDSLDSDIIVSDNYFRMNLEQKP